MFGAIFGLKAGRQEDGELSVEVVVGVAILGMLAGGLVALADRPTRKAKTGKGEEKGDKGTFAGRFIALLSLFLWWVPFFGLIFGAWAFLTNRHGTGWGRVVAWIGFVLSAAVSVLFAGLLIHEALTRPAAQ
jgi:cytochrome c biogenesis protein CcdA